MNVLAPNTSPPPTITPARLWRRNLEDLFDDETGQDLVEYALIAVLIAMGALAAVGSLSGQLTNALTKVGNNLTSAT